MGAAGQWSSPKNQGQKNLGKEKLFRWRPIKTHRQVDMGMYRWLAGNLRLWSVQEPVSSWNLTKAYTLKQQGKIVRFTRII